MNYIHFQGWRVTNKWQRSAAEQALPEFNQAALAQLEAMGFPLVRCQKALLATGNSDPEAAMEWLFAHMEDPGTFFYTHYSVQPDLSHANHTWVYSYIDIDAPIVQTAKGGGGPEPSPEQIAMLADMGFSAPQARKALRETVCRLDAVQIPAL
jgi:ubiquitin carboxyl-terminal hydrolase 5/13